MRQKPRIGKIRYFGSISGASDESRNSPEAEAAVAADREFADRLRLRGTPSFLMNDLMVPPGAPPEFFDLALEQLQAQQKTAK